jgi:hypothetical protein
MFSEMIEKKRQEVQLELEAIEKRGRWRQGLGDSEGGVGKAASVELHSMVDMEILETGDKENRLEGNNFFINENWLCSQILLVEESVACAVPF